MCQSFVFCVIYSHIVVDVVCIGMCIKMHTYKKFTMQFNKPQKPKISSSKIKQPEKLNKYVAQ